MKYFLLTWKGCMLYHRLKVVFTAVNRGGFSTPIQQIPPYPIAQKLQMEDVTQLGVCPYKQGRS